MIKKCDKCGKLIPHDPEYYTETPLMLVVKDEIWKKIWGNKKGFLCPDCMEKIWGRKFKITELKTFPHGGIVPCNIWYIRRNYPDIGREIFLNPHLLRHISGMPGGKGYIETLKHHYWSRKIIEELSI